ncbi:hypothetical protein [Roseiconus lacunae]|uniref:hypothetical protein n=1 Tax=Roseiconus lacunae TaxID=2605694 RepID=UPI001E47CC97|nr:hypothetical protein [Roseiconus lacunae]MCD0461837.1 hypothetical protein [Roseiconus lacunae]
MNNVLSLRHSLLMIIIASALFRADASFADDSRRKEQSKIEGTVYASIADLTVLRDEVLSRYALMITGERQRAFVESANRPPLQIDRQYRLLAASKKDDFLYQAFGRVIGPEQSSRTFDFQYWAEYLKCSNVHKARVGPAALRGYSIKPDNLPAKKFVEQAGVGATRFDPFDELVAHVLFWSNAEKQKGWIEYIFLHSSELISAERITQGDIKSKWRWKHHSLDFEIELIQSKAVNFMPTKVKYTSKIPNMPGLFSEATITWKKHRTGKLLPHVVRGATGAPFGPTQQHEHLLFEWRLGDEIDDDFFDSTSADFRLQFTPLFEFYFDTYQKPGGLVTGTPWELPEELTRDPDKPAT